MGVLWDQVPNSQKEMYYIRDIWQVACGPWGVNVQPLSFCAPLPLSRLLHFCCCCQSPMDSCFWCMASPLGAPCGVEGSHGWRAWRDLVWCLSWCITLQGRGPEWLREVQHDAFTHPGVHAVQWGSSHGATCDPGVCVPSVCSWGYCGFQPLRSWTALYEVSAAPTLSGDVVLQLFLVF